MKRLDALVYNEKGDVRATEERRSIMGLMNPRLQYPHEQEADQANTGEYSYNKYFNQDLADDSEYFYRLRNYLNCIGEFAQASSGAGAGNGSGRDFGRNVCSREYAGLKVAVLSRELTFPKINRYYFQREEAARRGEQHN